MTELTRSSTAPTPPRHAGLVQATWGAASERLGRRLNQSCFCVSLDDDALTSALESELGRPGLFELVRERCPHLFSSRPVFVSPVHLERMAQIARAVETVAAMPAYREHVLGRAPAIARHDPGAASVFFGYDFHLEGDRLGLIEINTNAGGAMLNAVLARAQRASCAAVQSVLPDLARVSALENAIVAMFRNEWSLAGHTRPLRSVAIVDEAPEQQYLYPEFVLFQQLFERQGIRTVIADPSALNVHDNRLWLGDLPIDLVYNRLTDFALAGAGAAALHEAYLRNAVVVTPHPRAHALYADKRNLALLTDEHELKALGVPPELRATLLAGIPRTEVVDPAQSERLWAERRGLFFKPTSGFGGRAAYRGDKITKRVWEEILRAPYVAQALVAPGERVVDMGDAEQVMKFDLRNYVYQGAVQWVGARLYQGQTTNFRTPGGGFAPVYGTGAIAGLVNRTDNH
jgi:hypothetical protein